MIYCCIFLAFHIAGTIAKIYFKEEFSDDSWKERWIVSEHISKEWGKFVLTPGKYYGDSEISKGIQTSEDGKFYALTTKFEPFSNEGKVLVLQYSVKYEQDIKCGGAYIKLFDCSLNPKKFHSYRPYLIQFGPDICGFKKVHVIFNYDGRKLKMKRKLNCKDDRFTHLYTLVIRPDNSYMIKIDNKIERRGTLREDWDFLPPKMINDTKIKKPLYRNDNNKITDSTNEKLQDNNQTSPEFHLNVTEREQNSFEDILMVKNQGSKEEQKSLPIESFNYEGKRQVTETVTESPVHFSDFDLYKFDEICGIGLDIWQVESGTLFDNFLITDDELEAEKHGNDTWGATKQEEKLRKIIFDASKTTPSGGPILDPHDEL